MTDFSQMLRWNTSFVRGLAQSVLDRAKLIRGGLTAYSLSDPTSQAAAPAGKSTKSKGVKGGKTTSKKKSPTKKLRAPKGRRGRA